MNYTVGDRVRLKDVAFSFDVVYEVVGYDIDKGHKLYHLSPVNENDTVNHSVTNRRVNPHHMYKV